MEYSFFYIYISIISSIAISESNKSPSPLLWSPFQTEQQSKILLKYLLRHGSETFEIFQSSDRLKFSRFVERSLVTKTLSKRFAARNKIVQGKLYYKYFQKVTTKLQFMFSISHYLKIILAHDLKIDVDDLPIQSWSLLSCRIMH